MSQYVLRGRNLMYLYKDRGHEWFGGDALKECRRCSALSYGGTGAIDCPAVRDSLTFRGVRNRQRRALEARSKRAGLHQLRDYPIHCTCSGCRRPIRSSPAGLALGIRTRWRWVDNAGGPVRLPNGRTTVAIIETPDACSGTCFDAILADPQWQPVTAKRRAELDVRAIIAAHGELVCVYGGQQTQENVERVLAERPAR